MTDEDESADPGIIGAAERAILKFLGDREANEAIAFHEGTREDRGTSNVDQLAQHHWHPQVLSNKRRPSKNWRQ